MINQPFIAKVDELVERAYVMDIIRSYLPPDSPLIDPTSSVRTMKNVLERLAVLEVLCKDVPDVPPLTGGVPK